MMELVRIITEKATGEGLYAVRYEEQQMDEFERLFNFWIEDVEYLSTFFRDQRSLLQAGYYRGISVEQAVRATRKEAIFFRRSLLTLARRGIEGKTEALQDLFQPLDNNEYRLKPLQKSKARGLAEKRWLRMYAIRFAGNCFVVTGGAIKLTLKMELPYLKEELRKLEQVRQFLVKHDLLIQEDFQYLEL